MVTDAHQQFEPIAITSLGGVFPDAATPDALWEQIAAGHVAARSVSAERWGFPTERSTQLGGAADGSLHAVACLVDKAPKLVHGGARITDDTYAKLDPLYQLTLAAIDQALPSGAAVDPERTGLVLGAIALPTDTMAAVTRDLLISAMAHDLGLKLEADAVAERLAMQPVGHLPTFAAAAFGLGLGGYSLDAACASTYYALKFACDELQSRRADTMVAGGVSRASIAYTNIGFTQLRALSATGVCRPFDRRADGLVVGEGAGVFVLRRLADAERLGLPILGVIRGIGLSNDTAGSLLNPESAGQLRALRTAYRQAGWKPSDVDLIECHGTGTPVGDGVEITSLRKLFSEDGSTLRGHVGVGSVKSMVGHLLTGAGAPAMVKMLHGMQHGLRPRTAGLEHVAPACDVSGTALRFQTENEPWERRTPGTPRRAALNGFGFGGINAHVLVEEYLPGRTVHVAGANLVPAPSPHEYATLGILGIGAVVGEADHFADCRRALFGSARLTNARPSHRASGLDTAVAKSTKAGVYRDHLDVGIGEFRIPPAEIESTLPQQLCMLRAAHEAWTDAAAEEWIEPAHTGVYIGIAFDPQTTHHMAGWQAEDIAARLAKAVGCDPKDLLDEVRSGVYDSLTAPRVMGALGSIVASRVSREFGCGGPSFVLSCGAESGSEALRRAAEAIARGEISAAIVGAVDLAGDPRASLDQPLPADAAVALVLTDSRHLPSGQQIHALVQPMARGMSLDRFADAGLRQVEWVERPTDIPNLNLAAGKLPVAMTSHNGAWGGAGAAASLLGIAAAAASTEWAMWPKSNDENPWLANIAARSSDTFVPHETQYWLRNRVDGPRKAAVVHGDGTVAAIVTEPDTRRAAALLDPTGDPRPAMVFLGWNSASELERLLTCLQDAAHAGDALAVAVEFCRLIGDCSGSAEERAVVVLGGEGSSSAAEVRAQLARVVPLLRERALGTGDSLTGEEGIYWSANPVGNYGARLAFAFPGSGSHYLGMGVSAGKRFPHILHRLDSENLHLAAQMAAAEFVPWRGDWSPGWELDAKRAAEQRMESVIFAHVSHGVTMATMLQAFGVAPTATVGYSLGESTGHFSLGAWRDRDLMYRRMMESNLFSHWLGGECEAAKVAWQLPASEPVDWVTAVLPKPADAVREAIPAFPRTYLLIVNTPTECVVGGQRKTLEALARHLETGLIAMPGVPTVHCDVAQCVEQAYHDLHLFDVHPTPGISFYSVARGQAHAVTTESAARSITDDALYGFDFPTVVEQMYADGYRAFVEPGPLGWTCRMISRILGDRPHLALAVDQSGVDVATSLTETLARLSAEHLLTDIAPIIEHQESLVRARPVPKTFSRTVRVNLGSERRSIVRPQIASQPQRELKPSQLPVTTPTRQESAQAFDGGSVRDAGKADTLQSTIRVPNAVDLSSVSPGSLFAEFDRCHAADAAAHEAFLAYSEQAFADMAATLSLMNDVLAGATSGSATPQMTLPGMPAPMVGATPPARPEKPPRSHEPVFMDYDACLEFARGSIAKVLGSEFAEIDSYPTRVRLPDVPLMLVDRIVSVEGVKRSLTSGKVITEHDVLADKWYIDNGRMPVCVTVEAGQADLFLSAYLGIDFVTRGLRVYRLLDATITFHRGLPVPGETIRYDIRINRFVRSGDTYLFFFEFDGTIDGKPLLTMRNGCAGFFTYEEIAGSGGIVESINDGSPRSASRVVGGYTAPYKAPYASLTLSEAQVDAIRHGDLAAAFGKDYASLPLQKPAGIPGGLMRLVHRVTDLEPQGGEYGLGFIRAEADIHPDDWFLTCHFVDDMVMPGTLMYECCAHTLRILLMGMGWVVEEGQAAFEPVLGIPAELKCRAPVTAKSRLVTYEITIEEIGYRPEPYVVAYALMKVDGFPSVQFRGMSMQLSGMNRERLESIWSAVSARSSSGASNKGLGLNRMLVPSSQVRPIGSASLPSSAKAAIYTNEQIEAFAEGKPSDAFGAPYKVFDEDRRIARLPRDPYKFLDRITEIHGYEAFKFAANPQGWIEAQYEVPPQVWYYAANRQPTMPFAVLLEIALQPCGWLAAYVGSALRSDEDLSFRNLGGTAIQWMDLGPDAGLLTVRVSLTKMSEAGGMIIQDYAMQVWQGERIVYDGTTNFGFFSKAALANQLGIRDASQRRWSAGQPATPVALPINEPLRPSAHGISIIDGALSLPGRALLMVDQIDQDIPGGGVFGNGYIEATKQVDPEEWFFQAHFYQDPVCPGSLGLESFLQILKWKAIQLWGDSISQSHRFETMALGHKHTWIYRGQVIPRNKRVTVEVNIQRVSAPPTANSAGELVADGFLLVDGLPIYEMRDFCIRVVPRSQ